MITPKEANKIARECNLKSTYSVPNLVWDTIRSAAEMGAMNVTVQIDQITYKALWGHGFEVIVHNWNINEEFGQCFVIWNDHVISKKKI
jgi:hypothetical protein